jgi:dihydroxy-acid dehydratase
LKNTEVPGFFGGLTKYGDAEFSKFLRKVFLSSLGYDDIDLSRPVIGIADTTSGYVTCHREMPQLIDAIKRGVLEGGGLPVVFPTASLPEIMMNPTSMYLRNLLAIETEELIRAQPMDGVVLVGGCDKTVPAQLMAGISAGIPFMQVVAGPMIPGKWEGKKVGACTDCRAAWSDFRGGRINADQINEVAGVLAPSGGTCSVMGTASTMACISETLGFAITGSSTAAAPTGERLVIGVKTGRAIVEAVKNDLTPDKILSQSSFKNAASVLGALGGSTNAIIHLLAIARRAKIKFTLDDIARASDSVPVIVNCKPSGSGFMDDFHNEGGVPQLIHQIKEFFDLGARTMTNLTWGEILESISKRKPSGDGLREFSFPVSPVGGLRVLRGNLAPQGAVIKVSAATPELLNHTGKAVVFENIDDMMARIDDPNLEVESDSVLVLKNAGPYAAGMPEAGAIPIPVKIAKTGVRDMVRISDARMSGTAFGTVVLHISPESAVGGPLAIVQNGDVIVLDAANNKLEILLSDEQIAARLVSHTSATYLPDTHWGRVYKATVMQASDGADLDTSQLGRDR